MWISFHRGDAESKRDLTTKDTKARFSLENPAEGSDLKIHMLASPARDE
jgi:hypothetical protein